METPADPASRARPRRDGRRRRATASTWPGRSTGSGEPTVLLHADLVDRPVPVLEGAGRYLARHYPGRHVRRPGQRRARAVRPAPRRTRDEEYAADTVAVHGRHRTDGRCSCRCPAAASWSVHVAAGHPERVLGHLRHRPVVRLRIPHRTASSYPWDGRLDQTEGWAKYNRHYWLEGDYEDFLRFFFGRMFTEPHSTKQIEDARRLGPRHRPADPRRHRRGRLGCDGAVCAPIEALCAAVRCPVRRRARHRRPDPPARHRRAARRAHRRARSSASRAAATARPAATRCWSTALISDFVDRVCPTVPGAGAAGSGPLRRPQRALYLSSPIGLGPRPPRRRDRRRAAAAAARTCRSTGSPSTR